MLAVILVVICPFARAADPNEGAASLSVETSSFYIGPFSAESAFRYFGSHRPGFAAAVPIRGPRDYLPLPTSPNMARWFATDFIKSYPGFSGQQRKLLTLDSVGDLFRKDNVYLSYSPQGDPNRPCVLLFGMTQEDAATMARAYAEFAIMAFRTNLGFAEEDVKKTAKELADLQKRIPEVDELLRTSQASLEELRKRVPYRTEEEAMNAVSELDRMNNAALVEIAGIRAKIEAIQRYQQEPPRPEQTARLSLMFIEESIALQAADARRRMAVQLRDEANRFVDLRKTLTKATGEKEILAVRLPDVTRDAQKAPSSVEIIRQKKPQIEGKITIYPVQWAPEPGSIR